MKTRTFSLSCILLSSLVGPSLAFGAEDCSPIRLDDVGGSMEHVVVRNQREIGSCYAHAAAQMYDAWRFRHGENETDDHENFSSGFEIGLRFKVDENARVEQTSRIKNYSTDINGGLVPKILPFLLKEGTCSQKGLNGLLRSDIRQRDGLDLDRYASEVMRKFNKYKQRFIVGRAEIHRRYHPEEDATPADPLKTPIHIAVSDRAPPQEVRNAQAQIAFAEQDEISRLSARILEEGISEVKNYNAVILSNPDADIHYDEIEAEDNTVRLFDRLSVFNCVEQQRRITRGEYEVETHSISTSGMFSRNSSDSERLQAFSAATRAEFAKGLRRAYPIGIAYCSAVLAEGRAYQTKSYSTDECGRHASLVIGRRRDPSNPNRCQYLIRNTWGKSCAGYHKDWACEAERGSLWIDAETLSRATSELQTLETVSD